MTIPLLALLGLATPVVYDRVAAANRATDIAQSVETASTIGALVQDLQLERLLGVGYKIKWVDKPTYEGQIDAVNTRVTNLLGGGSGPLSPEIRVALGRIGDLGTVRDQIFAGTAVWTDVTDEYARQIGGLIDAMRLERGVDAGTPAGQQVVGLDAVLRADEEISQGASLLVLMADDPTNSELFVNFESALVQLQSYQTRFTQFGTPDQVNLYNQLQTELSTRLGTITYAPGTDPRPMLSSDPLSQVFPGLQDFIRAGLQIETKIIDDVTGTVSRQKNTALLTAYGVIGAVLVILVLVGLLSAAVARAVVRPLSRLTSSAERVARVAGEELVRVADDEVESTSVVHLDPVDVGAQDEIGDLARAFEQVQTTAVQLVERQAVSRRNVAQMFAHVGRRTQNLVARQVALIDALERDEADPGRLQQLYRLDHVSSRLRRNAQSLVVLSGGEGADPHVHPLPLGDIVRLALGEIEDYTRVDIDVPADLVVAPAAVSDLVLLLAELMENATAFSPPHSRVTVFAQPLPHGAARVSVVDHGLGLTPERLAEENARLDRRERLDLTPTEVLGLFVVGRLSRRHGIAVTLLATPGGGVTATVQLPPALLVQPTHLTTQLPPPGRSPAGELGRYAGGPAAELTGPQQRPALTGRVVARAAVQAGDLNPADVVNRAIESVRTAGAWNAFATPVRPDAPPPPVVPAPAVSWPLPATPLPATAPPPAPPAPAPAPVVPAPVASPPAAPPPAAPPPAAPARSQNGRPDNGRPENGRPQFARPENGRPEPARPTLAPSGTPLHRRVPGVALDAARGDSPFATASLSSQQADPEQVRALVEQFEAGIFRALGEVRNNPNSEGTTR